MNCHWSTSFLFLRISLDLLTSCSCILFRCNLIWHHFCWLHWNHFHRRVALLPTLPLWTIVSLRKFILYFNIFVNYSYCSRRVVLVRIPPTTRRRSSPPPPDFLTSYLEKTALGNWTGLYLVIVFVFVLLFIFVFVFVFVSSPPLDSRSSFLEKRHFASALLYLHPSIVRLVN